MGLFKHKKQKVVVGMSGGVDSSVAAALLKKQGYDVIGVFMKNWSDDFALKDGYCPWEEDQRDARRVAAKLDIPIYTFNFEQEYKNRVLDYFFKEYQAGRTPNPDIMCNKEIKFKEFLNKAMELGADYIATGHYACQRQTRDNKFELLKGVDQNKDQSYFLYAISQQALQKTLFPIGEYTKPEIRKIAAKLKLSTKNKKDSQGICFIGEVDLRQFLSQYIKDTPGKIIDLDSGKVVGKHEGLSWYTIGQRKGMNVGGTGLPLYVADKDLAKNELYVVKGNYNPLLFKQELIANDLTWINDASFLDKSGDKSVKLKAKIRYRQQDQECEVIWEKKNESIKVIFKESQRAVTPGQSLVLYDRDVCLGGGIIQ